MIKYIPQELVSEIESFLIKRNEFFVIDMLNNVMFSESVNIYNTIFHASIFPQSLGGNIERMRKLGCVRYLHNPFDASKNVLSGNSQAIKHSFFKCISIYGESKKYGIGVYDPKQDVHTLKIWLALGFSSSMIYPYDKRLYLIYSIFNRFELPKDIHFLENGIQKTLGFGDLLKNHHLNYIKYVLYGLHYSYNFLIVMLPNIPTNIQIYDFLKSSGFECKYIDQRIDCGNRTVVVLDTIINPYKMEIIIGCLYNYSDIIYVSVFSTVCGKSNTLGYSRRPSLSER